MKKTFCRVILLSVLAVAMAACGRQNPDALLASADDAISISDYRSAQNLCDNLSDIVRTDTLSLQPSQYCRLAFIYMTLAEHQSAATATAEDNIAAASAMFINALRISPDSVQKFLNGLAPEDIGHAELLLHLSEAAEARNIIQQFEEPDSIPNSSHNHGHEN
ncbi:MAG: hypothetical protein OSJ34_03070 [Muribaculaceae bacterium]|jgi:hypothetical protein|nr:hypothetical protein [Muribaculaceae bacterium]